MDHKWGRNVTLLGVGGTGCTLAARRLDSPFIDIVTNELSGTGSARIWRVLAFLPFDGLYLPQSVGPVTGNFPYGIPVEPDGPV